MATTVQDVIDLILKEVPGAPIPDTVDTLKAGDPSWPVTGIVTTFMSTVPVLRQAAERGANFVITHEPTFYNHRDEVDWLKDDPVYRAKREYIEEQRLAIWRFHDHWHMHEPDGILTGVLRQLGWDGRLEPGKWDIKLPDMSLADLVAHLRNSMGAEHIRVVGSANMTCRHVAFLPGSPPGEWQINALREVDVLIGGEAAEWQTVEYLRDALAVGQQKALILVGHERSEEAGMAYLMEWLGQRLPGVRISHIESGDPMA
jgi:putative NIF3 family GTP cyclohydrolase 1 type 2